MDFKSHTSPDFPNGTVFLHVALFICLFLMYLMVRLDYTCTASNDSISKQWTIKDEEGNGRDVSTYLWLYSPLLDLGHLSVSWSFTQWVGFLGRGISPSQGRYLYTHDNTNTEQTHTDIHDSSGVRTHDASVWAGEDSSCLRPRGHCDRPTY
jgi:hypothetical protein